ncbi:putative pollen-specific leucine-rich repeat extensin-like protein 3 [Iris pallida]|uniref:Pollen-specific leucine-rich repeat extensin-like protein 3 n=1 Tax=Iris pallida TaxID=29817 RepID=A0AAX6HYF6_IRIPA|nr:putative pollen-specific leucine-rich repeat extensin-like protein 3 [Iris pallida]
MACTRHDERLGSEWGRARTPVGAALDPGSSVSSARGSGGSGTGGAPWRPGTGIAAGGALLPRLEGTQVALAGVLGETSGVNVEAAKKWSGSCQPWARRGRRRTQSSKVRFSPSSSSSFFL